MIGTEQGVLHISRLINRLIHILWIISLCLSQAVLADKASTNKLADTINNGPHYYITLLYSENSEIQSEIASKIKRFLLHDNKNIVLSELSSPSNEGIATNTPELVIAIGLENIKITKRSFRDADKLLIATSPGEYQPVTKPDDNNTLLYMSQPYCRQIQFIKLINSEWRSFSYLGSQHEPDRDTAIQQCAHKYDVTAYKVVTSEDLHLTHYLKQALSRSDLILALPDKAIYNSKSVKNILLTSYRDRKPIIAFSRNFVNAGALAAIHSDADQIAATAVELINEYLGAGGKFVKSVNYPRSFNISINTQVFRALDLSIPDTAEIARILQISESNQSGGAP